MAPCGEQASHVGKQRSSCMQHKAARPTSQCGASRIGTQRRARGRHLSQDPPWCSEALRKPPFSSPLHQWLSKDGCTECGPCPRKMVPNPYRMTLPEPSLWPQECVLVSCHISCTCGSDLAHTHQKRPKHPRGLDAVNLELGSWSSWRKPGALRKSLFLRATHESYVCEKSFGHSTSYSNASCDTRS